MSDSFERVPAVLVWEPYDGKPSTVDDLGCDLSGHFWARAKRLSADAWSYTVWDYQNNVMLDGSAPTLVEAQEAVGIWDRDVVRSGVDPSKGWADHE